MYEITENYDRSFDEYREELTGELTNAAESFVRIGYLLKVARDTNILEGKGYDGYIDFAHKEYGLDKTQVSRFININDRFSEGGNGKQLQEQYKGYGYAKLTLMLTLPDAVNEELSPDMTKSEIQDIKDEVDAEKKVTDIERYLEIPASKGTTLEKTIFQLGHDDPDLFMSLCRGWKQTEESTYEIFAPDGEKIYSVRVAGIGRLLLSINGEKKRITLTNVRTGEKGICTIEDLIKAAQSIVFPDFGLDMETGEEVWTALYHEDFPKKTEVAPVQLSKKDTKVQKAPPEKTEKEKAKEREKRRQAQIDKETKERLEAKEDEKFMNTPLPSETREDTHELTCAPANFEAMADGSKPFELLKNDKNYHTGDTLIQREVRDGEPTGRELIQEITYILEGYTGLTDGYCILGLKLQSNVTTEDEAPVTEDIPGQMDISDYAGENKGEK